MEPTRGDDGFLKRKSDIGITVVSGKILWIPMAVQLSLMVSYVTYFSSIFYLISFDSCLFVCMYLLKSFNVRVSMYECVRNVSQSVEHFQAFRHNIFLCTAFGCDVQVDGSGDVTFSYWCIFTALRKKVYRNLYEVFCLSNLTKVLGIY